MQMRSVLRRTLKTLTVKVRFRLKISVRVKNLPQSGRLTAELIQPFGVEHTVFVSALIGMRTEVVTLSLDQVRWQYR